MKRIKKLALVASTAVIGAAVVEELRKPASTRTWQGRILGIPYDLRVPTPARVIGALWRPDDPRLIVERPPFGVGWGINVARLVPANRHSGPQEL